MSGADVEAMVDSLGDMAAALGRAGPDKQAMLYGALRLDLRYLHAERAVLVEANPRVLSVCVRGGTPAPSGGIPAQSRYSCS